MVDRPLLLHEALWYLRHMSGCTRYAILRGPSHFEYHAQWRLRGLQVMVRTYSQAADIFGANYMSPRCSVPLWRSVSTQGCEAKQLMRVKHRRRRRGRLRQKSTNNVKGITSKRSDNHHDNSGGFNGTVLRPQRQPRPGYLSEQEMVVAMQTAHTEVNAPPITTAHGPLQY